MIELLSVFTIILASFFVGGLASFKLQISYEFSIPLGLSLLIFLCNFLVITLNLPTAASFLIVALIAIASFLLLVRKNISLPYYSLAGTFFCFLLLTIPVWVGGSQFYAFRGNWWDHFNYISALLSLKAYPMETLRNISVIVGPNDPITLFGAAAANARPSAPLLAAIFLQHSTNVFLYAYLFLAAMLACTVPSVMLLGRDVFLLKGRTALGIAVILPLGFWGQFLIDTSVWSHIVAFPLIIALLAVMVQSERPSAVRPIQWNATYAELLLAAGAFVAYPEGAAVALGTAFAARFAATRSAAVLVQSCFVLSSSILIASLLDYSGTVKFVWLQIAGSMGNEAPGKTWFLYFARFYGGFDVDGLFGDQVLYIKNLAQSLGPFAVIRFAIQQHPYLLLLSANVLPVALGFYFPIATLSSFNIAAGIVVGVAYMGMAASVIGTQVLRGRGELRAVMPFFGAFIVISAALVIGLFTRGQLWEASKAISYLAPIVELGIVLLLAKASFGNADDSRRNLARVCLFFWFVSSVGMMGARVYYAADASGIGHPNPYPSIGKAEDKKLYRYRVPEGLGDCKGIIVSERHPNRSLYLLIMARQYAPTLGGNFALYGLGEWLKHEISNKSGFDCVIAFEAIGPAGLWQPVLKKAN